MITCTSEYLLPHAVENYCKEIGSAVRLYNLNNLEYYYIYICMYIYMPTNGYDIYEVGFGSALTAVCDTTSMAFIFSAKRHKTQNAIERTNLIFELLINSIQWVNEDLIP